MKRIFALLLVLTAVAAYAVDLGSDFPAKGFARGDALNAKFTALNNGKIDATGTANITGSLVVTGNATVGTLESGAATFTAGFQTSDPALFGTNYNSLTYAASGLFARGKIHLGANMYYNGAAWAKMVTASPSYWLDLDYLAGPRLYTSDAGNSAPDQNGPYTVLHSGLLDGLSLGNRTVVPTGGTFVHNAGSMEFCKILGQLNAGASAVATFTCASNGAFNVETEISTYFNTTASPAAGIWRTTFYHTAASAIGGLLQSQTLDQGSADLIGVTWAHAGSGKFKVTVTNNSAVTIFDTTMRVRLVGYRGTNVGVE